MSLKTLREALTKEEGLAYTDWPPDVRHAVDQLIIRIDQHRPLGTDGTHGSMHTSTCGCEDKT